MERIHQFIQQKLSQAKAVNQLRRLQPLDGNKVDFFSNDYLGFSKKGLLQSLIPSAKPHSEWMGATGSRLISGNHPEITRLEKQVAQSMGSPAALLYNSGYLANVGLLSALGDKDSLFIYDDQVHASIKEGMRLGFGQKTTFKHNDSQDLEKKLRHHSDSSKRIYILTEGLFSMDGDYPDLNIILQLCEQFQAALIIDEAHALGTLGHKNKGLAHQFRNHPNLLARVLTFGKAAGCHGAMVLGNENLIHFLVNFSRAFIYTTAPSFDQVRTIHASWQLLEQKTNFQNLDEVIQKYLELVPLESNTFSKNKSPIQAWFCSDISRLKQKAALAHEAGFNIYPILSPTVKKGTERIRIVLHAFNSPEELSKLIDILNS